MRRIAAVVLSLVFLNPGKVVVRPLVTVQRTVINGIQQVVYFISLGFSFGSSGIVSCSSGPFF